MEWCSFLDIFIHVMYGIQLHQMIVAHVVGKAITNTFTIYTNSTGLMVFIMTKFNLQQC